MNEAMVIWFTVISLVMIAFVLRAIEKFREENSHSNKPIHYFELAKEKEVFYCPGDDWGENDDL